MVKVYEMETPEWQLQELAKAADHAGNAFYADAVRFQQKAEFQRNKAEKFRKALEKLNANNDGRPTGDAETIRETR